MAEQPCFLEVLPTPTVFETLSKFSDEEGLILFESVRTQEKLGRYSFLVAEPVCVNTIQQVNYGDDPFQSTEDFIKDFTAQTIPELPPFQGGCAGLLSYELGRCWERLPTPEFDEFEIPAAVIGVYDWVIAWDHSQQKCWVIAHGFPEKNPDTRHLIAKKTCERLVEKILSSSDHPSKSGSDASSQSIEILTNENLLPASEIVSSNFSQHEYQAAVHKVIDYIFEGDIFQANLSQRFIAESCANPLEVYGALRQHNPAPFAGMVKFADWAVHSSSPERFIQKSGEQVWTRPIKGTRQRRPIPEADLYTRDELRESQKDQAENVMIVDLMRNDLSRICLPGTIRVPELCSIEAYETVTHLVSEVTGQLQPQATFWDTLRATFPGGSITGAPKIRAMEIITELERVARGPYCGSMFYLGFDGTADSNILIRTILQRGNKLAFPAGGGIVSQSDPKSEYEETLHKSDGMRTAIQSLY